MERIITLILGLSLLALCWLVLEKPDCYHGIAHHAYEACRADPTCLKPPGFKAEPAKCRQ
jgi:hypothetical protein